MRDSYHCQILKTDTVLQLHCRFGIQPGRVQFRQHCQFVAQADSDTVVITMVRPDSDSFNIIAGLRLEPALLAS
jgi:hypothetical protein